MRTETGFPQQYANRDEIIKKVEELERIYGIEIRQIEFPEIPRIPIKENSESNPKGKPETEQAEYRVK